MKRNTKQLLITEIFNQIKEGETRITRYSLAKKLGVNVTTIYKIFKNHK